MGGCFGSMRRPELLALLVGPSLSELPGTPLLHPLDAMPPGHEVPPAL